MGRGCAPSDGDSDGAIGVYAYLVSVRGGVGRCIARVLRHRAVCAKRLDRGRRRGISVSLHGRALRCVGGVYEYTT